MRGSDEFQLAFTHVEKLLDRRQSTTSFYLSVNSGILAIIALLVKDSGLTGLWLVASALLLLVAGFIACWIWRSLLYQYEILLDWWYARLREMEAAMPDSVRLVTREYEDLYVAAKQRKASQRIGMTAQELALNRIFTGLYALSSIGILLSLLI